MFLVLSQGRAAASEETGTIRAKAVRIRGSPESAYPFMKGSPAPWTDLACSQREWRSASTCAPPIIRPCQHRKLASLRDKKC